MSTSRINFPNSEALKAFTIFSASYMTSGTFVFTPTIHLLAVLIFFFIICDITTLFHRDLMKLSKIINFTISYQYLESIFPILRL